MFAQMPNIIAISRNKLNYKPIIKQTHITIQIPLRV